MFTLEYGDKRPVYEQIKEKIKQLIISGVLRENERIPSVRDLAVTMAINPNTILKAYRELEKEGYLYSLRAKGYFVAPIDAVKFSARTSVLLQQMKSCVKELFFLGAEKDKLVLAINEIYSGGKSND